MLQDHVGRITYMQVIVIGRLRLQQLREMCAGFSFTKKENQHRCQAKKLIPPKLSCIGLPQTDPAVQAAKPAKSIRSCHPNHTTLTKITMPLNLQTL